MTKIERKLAVLLLAVAMIVIFVPVAGTQMVYAASSGTCGNNVTWTLDNGILTISGSGPMTDFLNSDGAPWAPSDRYSVTRIVIGDGVTSIGDYAFAYCTQMTSISMGKDIKTIGKYAFYQCYQMYEITLPEGLESIRDNAFAVCAGLSTIRIPDSVTSMGTYVFNNCSSLKEITFPGGMTNIGNNMFPYCSNLETVVFAEGVRSLGYDLCKDCPNLKNVSIPSTLTNIGNNPFSYCPNLTNITVDAENPSFTVEDGVLFNKNKTKIVACPDTKDSYVIPSTVTTIGNGAFMGCKSLQSITIPSGVNDIGSYAFRDCISLQETTLPSGLTKISNEVFYDCEALETVTILGDVTFIGLGAFHGCKKLENIAIPDGVSGIYQYVFSGCESLSALTIPASITEIGMYAFDECTSLKEITFLGDAPTIDETAFYRDVIKAYYPKGNATWTESVRRNYSGTITWQPYSGSGTEDDPWQIGSEQHWNMIVEAVENGMDTSSIYFCLTDDISVTTMMGTQAHPFSGKLDGAGHTLTFNSENHPDGTAPFRYVKGAAISNLHVTGSITGTGQRASGLIGENSGTSTVTNCRVSATISGSRLISGFCIGTGDTLSITGCVFDGKITGNPDQSGCFVAWGTSGLSITDSIAAPQSDSDFTGGTFCYEGGGAPTLTNCYYIQAIGAEQGKQAHSVKAANGVDISFGSGTKYNVSKITAYEPGLEYNDVFYTGKEEQIALTMPDLSSQRKYYVASAGEFTGSGTNYTLVMPDEDVVISTESEPAISIKDAKVVLSKTAFTYNAKVQKPTIKTIKGLSLKEGTDYAAKWSNGSSKNAGTYTVTITGKGNYTGTAKATYMINKATNPLKIGAKTATIKYSKLRKKTQTLAVSKVIKFTKKADDKKTYTLVSAKKGSKSFKKYFKINKTTGKVTVKKGLKKGTYKVKVKVKAAGNANYKASAVKTVTFKVKVK